MSNSYFQRLRWEFPSVPAAAAIDHFSEKMVEAVDGKTMMERALRQVGLPTGSTDEARSSPLLEARDLLRAAAEIEHGLLVQYLYAAYSCTKLPIRGTITQIAKEEMGHLISVQNLILAIGGHPYFGRDDFPSAPTTGDVFPFALTFEPVSLDSLAKYIVAESPPLENITEPTLKARVAPIVSVGKGKAQQAINHVGALYLALYWLFKEDDSPPAGWPGYPRDMVLAVHTKLGRTNWHIPTGSFAKREDFDDLQADNDKPGEDWNKGDTRIFVFAVPFLPTGSADREAMLTTLFSIAEQGEGWEQSSSATEKSHFLRFLETYESIKAMPAGAPAIAAKVPINPSTVESSAVGFIANPEANLWGQIFNVRYRIALLKLALSMASRRSLDAGTIDGRSSLISDAIESEMKSNLRTIALELIRMRRKGVPNDGPELMRAAPPFELPAGSLPNLIGLDPDPKVAEAKAITLLRRALKVALDDTVELVNRVNALPINLLDLPAHRDLLNSIVGADAGLLAAL